MEKVLVVGTSGMVGGEVLKQCLELDEIDQVVSLNRDKLNVFHPKLKEVTHDNFLDYSAVSGEFSNVDLAFYCIGV